MASGSRRASTAPSVQARTKTGKVPASWMLGWRAVRLTRTPPPRRSSQAGAFRLGHPDVNGIDRSLGEAEPEPGPRLSAPRPCQHRPPTRPVQSDAYDAREGPAGAAARNPPAQVVMDVPSPNAPVPGSWNTGPGVSPHGSMWNVWTAPIAPLPGTPGAPTASHSPESATASPKRPSAPDDGEHAAAADERSSHAIPEQDLARGPSTRRANRRMVRSHGHGGATLVARVSSRSLDGDRSPGPARTTAEAQHGAGQRRVHAPRTRSPRQEQIAPACEGGPEPCEQSQVRSLEHGLEPRHGALVLLQHVHTPCMGRSRERRTDRQPPTACCEGGPVVATGFARRRLQEHGETMSPTALEDGTSPGASLRPVWGAHEQTGRRRQEHGTGARRPPTGWPRAASGGGISRSRASSCRPAPAGSLPWAEAGGLPAPPAGWCARASSPAPQSPVTRSPLNTSPTNGNPATGGPPLPGIHPPGARSSTRPGRSGPGTTPRGHPARTESVGPRHIRAGSNAARSRSAGSTAERSTAAGNPAESSAATRPAGGTVRRLVPLGGSPARRRERGSRELLHAPRTLLRGLGVTWRENRSRAVEAPGPGCSCHAPPRKRSLPRRPAPGPGARGRRGPHLRAKGPGPARGGATGRRARRGAGLGDRTVPPARRPPGRGPRRRGPRRGGQRAGLPTAPPEGGPTPGP